MIVEQYQLSKGECLKGHSHPNLLICIIEDGGFTELSNGVEIECHKDTIRLSPANTLHNLTAHNYGAHCTLVELPYNTIKGLSTPLKSSIFINLDSVKELVMKLLSTMKQDDRFTSESAALELTARTVSSTRDNEPPKWLEDFKQELLEGHYGSYSLEKLAARFDYHRSHAARSFRMWYGRSPGSHLRAYRLSVAERILRESDQPIVQVAYELGFVDQAHFSKLFLQKFGQTPASYRKEIICNPETQL